MVSTDDYWRYIFAFFLILIMGVFAQFEWQARDAFDEIKIKYDKVTQDNFAFT
jgi:hypothetical protein